MQWWVQFSEIVRNAALLVGGAIGIYLAWLRVTASNQQAEAQKRQAESSARQTDLGQRKLVTDLFQQAVGQLRDEKMEIRLLAIYTLQQIADEYPAYKKAVIALLTEYIRENPRRWENATPPVDIAEILKIVGLAQET